MAKSVTVASALGWVGICTGWNEVEYRVVDLHRWGPRSRADKQIKSFVRDWIRAGREGQSWLPQGRRVKKHLLLLLLRSGAKRRMVCMWVCVCGCVRESGLVWLVAL